MSYSKINEKLTQTFAYLTNKLYLRFMNGKKDKVWLYHLGVYSPSSKKVVHKGGRCFELEGATYPYRRGYFMLEWLAPFHVDYPEYWDINYERPEK